MEKAYKTMTSSSVMNITLGIIMIVAASLLLRYTV